MLSQLESLRKKLKGGDKASRKAYHNALTNYLNDLKTARKDRTNYIASSCRGFGEGWKELPETRGFLESLLSKGGHKDVVKAVVYDPAFNDLKTCVDMETFHAAKQWQQNTQGILDMQEDFSDIAVALPALLKAVTTLMDAASQFVVGSPTHPARAVRGEDKEIVMVKGADGQQHPVNTCEASISEEECQSKTDTYGGEQACMWMPSQTANVRKQMEEWYASPKGETFLKNNGKSLKQLEQSVCVPKVEFPLPLRDATDVDIAALQLGKQLLTNDKQAMRSSGTMSQLRSASIGNDDFATKPTSHYKDAYANARKSRKVGSRVFPTQVPYIREVKKNEKGEAKIDFVKAKTASSADANAASSSIGNMWRNKMMMKKLPLKVQKKIEKVQAKMTALRQKYKAELMSSDIAANQIDKAAQIKLEKDESYVSPADIRDYAVYQMVSATKGDGKPVLTESELHEILQSQHAGENYVRVSTSDSDSSAWQGLLSNYSNYKNDFKAIRAVVDKRTQDRKVKPKKSTWTSKNGTMIASSLQDFLSAGGIPYEHPPANSEIGRRSFAMINEGSLSGGELAYGEWDNKANPQQLTVRRTKDMIVDEAEDKNVKDSFGEDIVQYADTGTNLGSYQFILTPVELIVLKAIMKNNKQMIPWFRSFYNKKGMAQTGDTDSTSTEADWVFANEDQDVKELAYLMANLPDGNETYTRRQNTVANFASALLRFPTEQQEAEMKLPKPRVAGQEAQEAKNSRDWATNATYKFPLFFQDTKLLAELARHNAEGISGKKLIHYLIGDTNDAQKFLSWRANLDGYERNYRAAVEGPDAQATGRDYNENESDDMRKKQQFPQATALPKAGAWKEVLAAGIKNPPVVYEVEVQSVQRNGSNGVENITVKSKVPAIIPTSSVASYLVNIVSPNYNHYGIIRLGNGVWTSNDADSSVLTLDHPAELDIKPGQKLRLGENKSVKLWNDYQDEKDDDKKGAAFRDLRKIAELARAKYATRMGQQRFRKKKNSDSMKILGNL